MSNFQVVTKSGATADFLTKTFSSSAKSDAGSFDFANAFESKVSGQNSFDSYLMKDKPSMADQYSYTDQNSYEQSRFEESAPRPEKPRVREDEVRSREEEPVRPEKDEQLEKEPVEEKVADDLDDEPAAEKSSDKKDSDKKDDKEKPEETAETKEDKSEDDAPSDDDKKKKNVKIIAKNSLKDVDLKTDVTETKVEVKSDIKVEAKADLEEVEVKGENKEAVEAKGAVVEVKKTTTQGNLALNNKPVVAKQAVEADDVEMPEEGISTKLNASDQAKLEAVQLKQAVLAKNSGKAVDSKFSSQQDMMNRLEKETGVKIDKMSLEQVKAKPDETAAQTSKDLLKSLDVNRSRFEMKNPQTLRGADVDVKEVVVAEKPELKLNKLDIAKNLLRNNTSRMRGDAQQSGNNNNSNSNNNNNNESQNAFANTTKEQAPTERAGKTMQQAQTGQSTNLRNMNNVHDIMNNLKTMLRGADLDAKAKLVMDFKTQQLGQMRMGVMHKTDGIDISLQVGSDSSRQELMKQKDELSEQLRNMGYKHVNVDISYGEHQQQEDERQQKLSGNEDIRNVKLAGDEQADLSDILAMS